MAGVGQEKVVAPAEQFQTVLKTKPGAEGYFTNQKGGFGLIIDKGDIKVLNNNGQVIPAKLEAKGNDGISYTLSFSDQQLELQKAGSNRYVILQRIQNSNAVTTIELNKAAGAPALPNAEPKPSIKSELPSLEGKNLSFSINEKTGYASIRVKDGIRAGKDITQTREINEKDGKTSVTFAFASPQDATLEIKKVDGKYYAVTKNQDLRTKIGMPDPEPEKNSNPVKQPEYKLELKVKSETTTVTPTTTEQPKPTTGEIRIEGGAYPAYIPDSSQFPGNEYANRFSDEFKNVSNRLSKLHAEKDEMIELKTGGPLAHLVGMQKYPAVLTYAGVHKDGNDKILLARLKADSGNGSLDVDGRPASRYGLHRVVKEIEEEKKGKNDSKEKITRYEISNEAYVYGKDNKYHKVTGQITRHVWTDKVKKEVERSIYFISNEGEKEKYFDTQGNQVDDKKVKGGDVLTKEDWAALQQDKGGKVLRAKDSSNRRYTYENR